MASQIISDLHLEVNKAYDTFSISSKAPHLALLGDIGNINAHKSAFLAFLSRPLHRFQTVLLIPGNHEAFPSSWPSTLVFLHSFQVQQDSTSPNGTPPWTPSSSSTAASGASSALTTPWSSAQPLLPHPCRKRDGRRHGSQ